MSVNPPGQNPIDDVPADEMKGGGGMLGNVDIVLKKGETCFSKFEATRMDTDYSDYEKEIDEEDGIIYITSQRFIFKGDKKVKTIPLLKIVSCVGETSTLTISPDNGVSVDYDCGRILASSASEQILAIINGANVAPLRENAQWYQKQEQEKKALEARRAEYDSWNKKAEAGKTTREIKTFSLMPRNSGEWSMLISIIVVIFAIIFYKTR